jgi:prephenate dehydratase
VTKIAYLGPRGTFSEEAALRFARRLAAAADLIPLPAIEDCAEAVAEGRADYTVIPVENSLEGAVHATLDLLAATGLLICAELTVTIEHHLLSTGSSLRDIRQVLSHPQALAQCRRYLRTNLPDALMKPAASTAEAAARVAAMGAGAAAVGSRHAAAYYNLNILASSIQDNGSQTRFIVLAQNGSVPLKAEKTSLLFAISDGPGSLFKVLAAFAAHDVNLTRIESRPAKKQLGDYLFFVDLAGARGEDKVERALRDVEKEVVMLKVLGSYPVLS